LSKNVPYAQLIEVSSTAAAVKLAQQEPGAAAVASRHAAVHFNVPILFQNIEDFANTETRFAVLGTQESGKTGHDKTAIIFRVAHNPGALVSVLERMLASLENECEHLAVLGSFPIATVSE
jgi:chorismate mutase/prephenate dehydratase